MEFRSEVVVRVRGRAMRMSSWANSADIRQSRRALALTKVLRETPPRMPMW